MNRKKQTTRPQFLAIVNQMKKKPDIARNLTKKDPETIQKFWENLKNQLNSLGPPAKEVSEWKKVWSDHKSALRKKLSQNRRELKATGGGENKEIFFTPLENEVIELVRLKDCVEGLPGTSCYGVPITPKPLNEAAVTSVVLENSWVVSETEMDVDDPGTNIGSENNPNLFNITTTNSADQPQKKPLPKQLELLQTQIHTQEKLYETISAGLSKMEERSNDTNCLVKKVYHSIDRLVEHQKKANHINQSLVDETKRHNARMEHLAMEKNTTKKQILEMQIRKINSELSE